MLRLVYSRTLGGVQQPTHGKFTAFYRDAMGKGAPHAADSLAFQASG